jgi:hypothetical protein
MAARRPHSLLRMQTGVGCDGVIPRRAGPGPAEARRRRRRDRPPPHPFLGGARDVSAVARRDQRPERGGLRSAGRPVLRARHCRLRAADGTWRPARADNNNRALRGYFRLIFTLPASPHFAALARVALGPVRLLRRAWRLRPLHVRLLLPLLRGRRRRGAGACLVEVMGERRARGGGSFCLPPLPPPSPLTRPPPSPFLPPPRSPRARTSPTAASRGSSARRASAGPSPAAASASTTRSRATAARTSASASSAPSAASPR